MYLTDFLGAIQVQAAWKPRACIFTTHEARRLGAYFVTELHFQAAWKWFCAKINIFPHFYFKKSVDKSFKIAKLKNILKIYFTIWFIFLINNKFVIRLHNDMIIRTIFY